MMEFIKQHIEKHLNDYIGEKEIDANLFDNIDNYIKKKRYQKLLIYIAKLIEFKSNSILNTLHIHFENNFDQELENIIFQLVVAKSFIHQQITDGKNTSLNIKNLGLELKINKIQQKLNELECRCPEGARARNGGNKLYKNWVIKKAEFKNLLNFYKDLKMSSTFSKKALINCKVGMKNKILESYFLKPLVVDIESSDFEFCYNILNTDYSINDIDGKWNLLDYINNVILFDCETKKVMFNYSTEELIKWNTEYDTNFENLLIITFGKGINSLNITKDKIQSVRDRFKIKDGNSYTILMSELHSILKRRSNVTNIEFIGFELSSFWDTFLLETSIRELYELRSIKLMNIYSICFNDEIKGYIIDNLFSKDESSELISSSTKMAILELRDEDIDVLKEALSNTLDLIINSKIKSIIIESLNNTPTIIFDEAIIRNAKLISKITNCIGITKSIKLKSWTDLLNSASNYFLILSYRDQGKFPNYYYPNILEIEYHHETTAKAILHNFLFGYHYKWSKYYLLKDYHKHLNHPIRENYFDWSGLKTTIEAQKPEFKLNIDWNLEKEYSNSEQRDSFKIKLKSQRAKSFNNSDLFIVSDEKNISLKVVKIDYLMSLESDDGKIFIQNLDEIQENINIYEKIVDQKQQEAELDVIRKQFNLGDESAGRLWKILLKNKAHIEGEEKLYYELKSFFESKGLKIVSQFHFKNSWINPQSESIAPLYKQVFIELCEYLKIPKTYFIIIQRIRNATKQSSRQSTRQMNQLLKDLFNDGCFDIDKNARNIINDKLSYYKLNHPLDELGIDENYLADNLVTLTELILPELKLLELENIEKIEQ